MNLSNTWNTTISVFWPIHKQMIVYAQNLYTKYNYYHQENKDGAKNMKNFLILINNLVQY